MLYLRQTQDRARVASGRRDLRLFYLGKPIYPLSWKMLISKTRSRDSMKDGSCRVGLVAVDVQRQKNPICLHRGRNKEQVCLWLIFNVVIPKLTNVDDRQRSTLSIYSTPASENRTLQETEATPPPPPHEEGESHEEPLSEMPDVQHKVEEEDNVELPPAADDSFEHLTHEEIGQEDVEVAAEPHRSRKERKPPTVIIEELDTPAIRREKNMARKRRKAELEKKRQDEAAAAAAAAAFAASKVELVDVSDLSSLSSVTNEEDRMADFKDDGDDESDYEEGDTSKMVVSAADARKAAQNAGLGPATLRVKENEVLEGGTLGAYLRPLYLLTREPSH